MKTIKFRINKINKSSLDKLVKHYLKSLNINPEVKRLELAVRSLNLQRVP